MRRARAHRKTFIDTPFAIGKYLVSPLARRLPDGRYAASVSIRSGAGRATHDRVLRLLPLFDTAHDAIVHASEQGLGWLAARSAPQPVQP